MQQQTPQKRNKLPEIEIQEERIETNSARQSTRTISNCIWNIATPFLYQTL